MPHPVFNRLTYRLAVATTLVALLPIAVGTLVTTLRAGMAFLDWPTSDGYHMLFYDWLRDLREGNVKKFLEHGHRLAGIVIGCFGLVLAGVAWSTPNRASVRWLATVALLGIIGQGLLGGLRVIEDERLLAMAHGQFAAVVFALLAVTWLVSSRGWIEIADTPTSRARQEAGRGAVGTLRGSRSLTVAAGRFLPLAVVTTVVLILQYILGGRLRHLGTSMHEHMGLALLALGLVIATAVQALRSGSPWLRRTGWAMLAIVVVQFGLGLAAFVTKYGFPWTGYVAVRGTPAQLTVASLHTIVGMLLVAAAVVYLVKVARLRAVENRNRNVADVRTPGLARVNGGIG